MHERSKTPNQENLVEKVLVPFLTILGLLGICHFFITAYQIFFENT
jgi:hypothetical protein